LKPRRGEGRTWERGLRLGSSAEREKLAAVWGKGMDLTGGPHPSAARERGERGKREPAGLRPRKGGAGRRGFGPKGRIEGKGKEKAFFPFYFFPNKIFKLFSK